MTNIWKCPLNFHASLQTNAHDSKSLNFPIYETVGLGLPTLGLHENG